MPYPWSTELQEQLVKRVQEHPEEVYLLGLEHPNVITLGRRSEPAKDLKISLEDLEKLDFQYFESERGGHATLHNHGQLVVYPIVNLNHHKISIRDFVCMLEKTLQSVLKNLGIDSVLGIEAPGVYTPQGKIAFLGLRINRGVTSHGISLNVSNNLDDFSFIRSCGVEKEKFDQVCNYGKFETAFIFDLFQKELSKKLNLI